MWLKFVMPGLVPGIHVLGVWLQERLPLAQVKLRIGPPFFGSFQFMLPTKY
jgi:hypothetical protein